MKRIFALCATTVLVSGCATVINGSTQPVSVTSDTVVGASCELKNSEGSWYVTTPGSAVISRTKNDLTVTCKKDGYPTVSLVVPSQFHAATFGNIIAGGVVGVVVDASTGANYEYDTPIKVSFSGAPTGASPAAADTSAPSSAMSSTATASGPAGTQ